MLPEKTNQPQQNLLKSSNQKMVLALEGKRISESTDEEIKQVLSYAIILIGIPEDRHGDELSKTLLVDYLRRTYPLVRLDEVRLSFDFAVEKKTNVNLVLYPGEFISAKYVSEFISAYLAFKKTSNVVKIGTPSIKSIGTNMQIASKLLEILKPETVEHLKKIGEVKRSRPDLPQLPYQDIHQKWLKQFDKLRVKFEVENTNGRFIRRYKNWKKERVKKMIKEEGKQFKKRETDEIDTSSAIDIVEYFEKKAEQLILAKQRKG